MRIRRGVVRAMWIVGATVLLLGVAAAITLLAWSPGTLPPIVDATGRPIAGSLSEKTQITVNGVEQGLIVRARDAKRPVLLFVHGGPALPEYAISGEYADALEDQFVVCWWEQRAAGFSYRSDMPLETMTVEQLVDDALVVVDHLRARFGQEKVYLLGHSWGTVVALQAAAKAPERFHAYIAVAQITRQLESERRAWAFMIEESRRRGDARMAARLEAVRLDQLEGVPNSYRNLRDVAMHELGVGTTRAMKSVVSGIFVPVIRSPIYTLPEKVRFWRAKWSPHAGRLWDEMIATNLPAKVQRLELPVYFLHGTHDWTVSYALAKGYFAALEAPTKGFYSFTESAHSPMFEEPARMRRVLREDVLQGITRLADPR